MISIVIPVFNEEENLEELNKRLLSVCNSLPTNFEIIYVRGFSSFLNTIDGNTISHAIAVVN